MRRGRRRTTFIFSGLCSLFSLAFMYNVIIWYGGAILLKENNKMDLLFLSWDKNNADREYHTWTNGEWRMIRKKEQVLWFSLVYVYSLEDQIDDDKKDQNKKSSQVSRKIIWFGWNRHFFYSFTCSKKRLKFFMGILWFKNADLSMIVYIAYLMFVFLQCNVMLSDMLIVYYQKNLMKIQSGYSKNYWLIFHAGIFHWVINNVGTTIIRETWYVVYIHLKFFDNQQTFIFIIFSFVHKIFKNLGHAYVHTDTIV